MRCPFCAHAESRVVDSRQNQAATRIRRRRECEECCERFTTHEVRETVEVLVLKKDGRREPLDKQKLLRGLLRACEKRPVSYEQVEAVADAIVVDLSNSMTREVGVDAIGGKVLERLRDLDPVAYVRFLSVYREFERAEEFLEALSGLVGEGRSKRGASAS